MVEVECEALVGWRWTPESVLPPPLDRRASPRLYELLWQCWTPSNTTDPSLPRSRRSGPASKV